MNPSSVIRPFRAIFGQKPTLVVRAPGRVNLIGEHTDYNEGLVMPAAIDKAVWFAVSPRTDRQVHLHALDYMDTWIGHFSEIAPSDQGWPNYLLGPINELLRAGHKIQGANVVFAGDIPVGAGLSSSAALESGVLFALNEIFQLRRTLPELAQMAKRAENDFVGMQCGIMDMYASLMGKADHVLQLDCRDLSCAYFPLKLSDYTLLLLDSTVKHALVDSEYNTRRSECGQVIAALSNILPGIKSLREADMGMLEEVKPNLTDTLYNRGRFVIEENERVLRTQKALNQGDLATVGQQMHETHIGLSQAYQVSCPEMDFLVETAMSQPGVLGARMMGGGFGGCTLNLVPKTEADAFAQNMAVAYMEGCRKRLKAYPVSLCDGVSAQ